MSLMLLIVAGVLLLVGFVVGLVFLILFLVKSLGGTTGGWEKLAEVYGTNNPPTGQVTKRETIQVGAVTYKRCVTLAVAEEGLYVFDLAKNGSDSVGRIQGRWSSNLVLAEGADADSGRSARGNDDSPGGGVPGDAGEAAGGTGVTPPAK